MGGGAVGLVLVWLLSCLPFALPGLWPPAEVSLGDASRLALAALPWMAWLGVPRTSGRERDPWLPEWAVALPPIAAALSIDLARSEERVLLVWTAVSALACMALLSAASRRAARGSRRTGAHRMVHALVWLALVPGTPLLASALELAGRPSFGTAPRWLALLARASPIGWIWSQTALPSSSAGWAEHIPWAALAVSSGLWAVANGREAQGDR